MFLAGYLFEVPPYHYYQGKGYLVSVALFAKGPKLGVQMSQSVTSNDCRYDAICQRNWLWKWNIIYIMAFSVAHWNT